MIECWSEVVRHLTVALKELDGGTCGSDLPCCGPCVRTPHGRHANCLWDMLKQDSRVLLFRSIEECLEKDSVHAVMPLKGADDVHITTISLHTAVQ